jgi:SHS2 domain-containing protein
VYEVHYHTADVRLLVTAPALDAMFADAMRGLFAVMHARPAGEPLRRRIVVDESANLTALLVDFLNEVLSRAQIAGEWFDDAHIVIEGNSLQAELTGMAPAGFEEDVKAVTYHEADVRQAGGMWTTMLVLDI